MQQKIALNANIFRHKQAYRRQLVSIMHHPKIVTIFKKIANYLLPLKKQKNADQSCPALVSITTTEILYKKKKNAEYY